MQSGAMGKIVLLGGLRFERGETVVDRFRSQKFGVLLAYLALFPRRVHTREELADLLWPDAELEAGRTNLRTGLSSLRRQLEPPGVPFGSVLVTDGRTTIKLANVETDVAKFDRLCSAAAHPSVTSEERVRLLTEAVQVYGGPLMPGCYETWALAERDRLAGMYLNALRGLSDHHESRGEWTEALDFARRAAAVDPLSEDAHADILRLLMLSGQQGAAQRYWKDLEQLFEKELGMSPSPELQEILTQQAGPRKRLSAPAASNKAQLIRVEDDAPALKTTTPVNLPLTLTRFFGRDAEMQRLCEYLRDDGTRLVTLTGPGGSGKTRLSIETGRALAEHFPGGVWFVPLADLNDPALWFDTIADSLGLNRDSAVVSAERVTAELNISEGRVLLILDNFEHLADAASMNVLTLLSRVPALSCLVTSRQRLMLDGEAELPVSPLPTPGIPGTPERLLEFPSIQLFVSRAQAARADFQLNARNAAAVAELCERLEGIPLALELAAAWSQTLTPAQMLARMERPFDLLVARRRDVHERHRTLRSTIEWSYHSLSPELQWLFAQLSVFQGGWTLEAAEGICIGCEPPADILSCLTELQDRSLLTASVDGEDMRFRMLETLREFAGEQLSTEQKRGVQGRHGVYFLRLAEMAESQLMGPEASHWINRMSREMDNLRAVLERAVRGDVDPLIGLQLSGAIAQFWRIRGSAREALAHFTQLLDRPENQQPTAVRAKALRGRGSLAVVMAQYQEAVDAYEASLSICRELGDRVGQCRIFMDLGNVSYYQSDFERAKIWYTDGLAIARQLENWTSVGRLLSNLGMIVQAQGDLETALKLYFEGRDVFHRLGDRQGIAHCLLNVGTIYIGWSRDDEARANLEECLALVEELGDRSMTALAIHNLGAIARENCDFDRAETLLNQAYALWLELEDTVCIAAVIDELGLLAQAMGQLDISAGLHARALMSRFEIDDKRGVAETLRSLAELAMRRGEFSVCAELLGAADAVLEPLGTPMSDRQQTQYENLLQSTQQSLGEVKFNEANTAGRARTLEQTITEIKRSSAIK